MTEIREKIALLDKIEFGGISILDFIDFDSLIKKDILELSSSPVRYMTASGKAFNKLMIENDGLIDKMIAGAKVMGNKRVDYCNLSTTIKNDESGNLSCYTVYEYLEQLKKIQSHLKSDYGIIVDFSDITLKELEINRTFKLDGDFETYHRVLNLIMTNLPSYMKNQMDYKKVTKGCSEYQTYYATSKMANKSKRYLLLKIYNKSKAIENIILITDSYMRVEFRLVGAEKIKRALGTNKFAELTDLIINDYFDAQIQKMLVQPFQKWKKGRDKYLLELMKEQRQKDIRHWQTNVLRILQNEEISKKRPILLDIEEIIPLVDKLDLKSNRRSDVKRNFRKQSQKYETVFCNGDDLKMVEILDKLTVKDIVKSAVKGSNNTIKVTDIGGMQKIA